MPGDGLPISCDCTSLLAEDKSYCSHPPPDPTGAALRLEARGFNIRMSG